MGARPVEQVLDEVEEARVGPLEILEDEHDRAARGEPLEEQPPGGEEVLALLRLGVAQAEQLLESRPDPGALLGVGQPFLEHRARASRAPRRSSPPRRSARATAPSRRAPSTRRRRRTRGSGRDASTRCRRRRRGTSRTPRRVATCRCRRSRSRRRDAPSSPRRSRGRAPSRGSARAGGRRTAARARRRGVRRRASTSPGRRGRAAAPRTCPSARTSRPSSYAIAESLARFVASPTSTVPGSAADWIRAAVLTRSPATMLSAVALRVTAASPVSTPARAWRSAPTSSPSAVTRRRGRAPCGRRARRRPPARPASPRPPSPRRR